MSSLHNDTSKPLILLSNDDGYDAPGLVALQAELAAFSNVIVCAPLTNQSASSHSLTLNRILRLHPRGANVFAIDGTPADCVYIALHSDERILPRWPDMVVSGMNKGPNLGVDVVYSGTVAAAREAAQRGIVALAVSASSRADVQAAAHLAAKTARALLAQAKTRADADSSDRSGREYAAAPLFSLNIPHGESWPLQATRLGQRRYDDEVIYRRDPRDREYLWIGGSGVTHDEQEDTDTAAWDRGHASLTPLVLDLFRAAGTPLAQAVAAGLAGGK